MRKRTFIRSRHIDYAVAQLEPRRLLAGMALDQFFGTGGVGFTDVNPLNATSRAAFVEPSPDGGFFVVGKEAPLLAKVQRSGVADPAYGQNGLVRLNQMAQIDPVKLMPLADGSVIIGANVTLPSDRIAVFIKFTPNGQLDTAYGANGIATVAIPTGFSEKLFDAALLADGSVIGVGNNNLATRDRGLILRFDANGGSSGPVSGYKIVEFTDTAGNPLSGTFSKVIPLRDGGYLIAGGAAGGPTSFTTYRRFAALGDPVLSFGVDGIKNTTTMPAGQMFELDGGLVLNRNNNNLTRFSLANGEQDTAYGVKTLVGDPPVAALPVSAALTRQGNLALVYKSSSGLTSALFDLNGTPVTVMKSTPSNSTSGITFNNYPEPGAALLQGDQLVAIYGDVAGLIQGVNKPLLYARFNVFENQPQLLDDGTDAYHLRLNDRDNDVSVRVHGTDLVATVDGVEHRVALSARTRVLIPDAGGSDTITIGDCAGLNIDLDTDAGDDVIRLDTSTHAASLRILAGDGADRIEMQLNASGAATDIGSLVIDGGAGNDLIELQGTSIADSIVLDQPSSATSSLRAVPTGFERINISTDGGTDLIRLLAVPTTIGVTVDAGSENDVIEALFYRNGFPNNVQTTLIGGSGNDRFRFNTSEWTYLIDGGTEHDSLQFIGTASDEFATLVDASEVRFGTGSTYSTLVGSWESIDFDGAGGTDGIAVIRTDSMPTRFDVAPGQLLVNGVSPINATSYERVGVTGGSGNDTLVASQTLDVLNLSFNGGGGIDQVTLDQSADTNPRLYQITHFVNAQNLGLMTFGVEDGSIIGGAGPDRFELTPSSLIRWQIDGGPPAGVTPGDELIIPIAGVLSPLLTPTSSSSGTVTFGDRNEVIYTGMESATLRAPRMLSAVYRPGTDEVVVTLETPITLIPSTQWPSVATTTNLTTSANLAGPLGVNDNGATTLTISLRAFNSPLLTKGNYRTTIFASALKDRAGNAFTGDLVVNFFVLPGDANRDRVVNFDDLLPLAQNYGRFVATGLTGYAKGDFDGNGRVDFADLLLLSQNYGSGLMPPNTTGTQSITRRRSHAEEMPSQPSEILN